MIIRITRAIASCMHGLKIGLWQATDIILLQ